MVMTTKTWEDYLGQQEDLYIFANKIYYSKFPNRENEHSSIVPDQTPIKIQ